MALETHSELLSFHPSQTTQGFFLDFNGQTMTKKNIKVRTDNLDVVVTNSGKLDTRIYSLLINYNRTGSFSQALQATGISQDGAAELMGQIEKNESLRNLLSTVEANLVSDIINGSSKTHGMVTELYQLSKDAYQAGDSKTGLKGMTDAARISAQLLAAKAPQKQTSLSVATQSKDGSRTAMVFET